MNPPLATEQVNRPARLSVFTNTRWVVLISIGSAVLTYWAVLLSGLGMDDYALIYEWKIAGLALLQDTRYNRLPFHFAIYLTLLQLPLPLAIILKIAAHTLNALLVRMILRKIGVAPAPAMLAAIIFLVWPSNTETMGWLIAGYNIFALLFALIGIYNLLQGNVLIWVGCLLVSFLTSEAAVLPILALSFVLLLYTRRPLWQTVAWMAVVAGSYSFYYVIVRRWLSPTNDLARYTIGIEHVGDNLLGFIRLLFAQATSPDAAWLWNRGEDGFFNMPLFPVTILPLILVPSLLIGLMFWIQREESSERKSGFFVSVVCLGLAFLCAVPFLLITGNAMQPRNTYIASACIAVIIAVCIGALTANARLQAGLLTAICCWALYINWSAFLLSYYPAHIVADTLIADLEQIRTETPAKTIFLIRDPKVVGSAFAITRDWGYQGIAKVWLGPDYSVSSDALVGQLENQTLHAGDPLINNNKGCVFVDWKLGKPRIETRALWEPGQLVLDCASNTVVASASDRPEIVITSVTQSEDVVDDFCTARCPMPVFIRDVSIDSHDSR